MRAGFQWLAVLPLLVLSGCVTFPGREASGEASMALSAEEERFAEALASYSLALVSEATLGAYQDALTYLRAAGAADPGNLSLALKVAAGHLARKEYDAAEVVLRRVLLHHPDSPAAHLVLGITCQLLQKGRCAERAFGTVIRLNPGHPDGYIRLASLRVAGGRYRAALSVLDRGFSRVGGKMPLVSFCDEVGRLCLAGGQPGWAIPFFERVVRHGPTENVLAREKLARAQAAAGRSREAIEGLLEVSRLQPNHIQAALLLGEIYESQGENEKAAEQFTRVIQSEPGDMAAVLRLAHLRLKERPELAVGIVEDAVRRKPDEPLVRVYLGLLYARLDRYADAVREYAKVEEQVQALEGAQELLPQFYFWYGSACERAGRLEEAERLLALCVQKQPDSAQALNYLAYLWAEKGVHLDRALEYVTRALERMPGEGAFLDTLGWIHYRKGNYATALKYLEKAVRVMPDDPVILEHLGDTWQALGKPGKARRFWVRSLQLDQEQSTKERE